MKSKDGRILFGGEDECPKWMKQSQNAASGETEGSKNDDSDSTEYEGDTTELPETDDDGSKSTSTDFDRDEEWDPPND